MNVFSLVPYRLLDPRPAEAARENPLLQRVNIPLSELETRMHELPPRNEIIPVAAVDKSAEECVAFLNSQGRKAALEPDFELGEGNPSELGRLWRPNDFLSEWIEKESSLCSPAQRALDLGCGSGRDAVYLASRGWQVTALDRLPDALERGIDLEKRYAPQAIPIEWREHDLDESLPHFDTKFHLILSFLYLNRDLLQYVHTWLEPNGILLMEVFTRTHRDHYGKPSSDHLTVLPGEQRELVPGLTLHWAEEDWRDNRHTLRMAAGNDLSKEQV